MNNLDRMHKVLERHKLLKRHKEETKTPNKSK